MVQQKPLQKAAFVFILVHLAQICYVSRAAIYVKSVIQSAEKPGKLTGTGTRAPEANKFLTSKVTPVSLWCMVEGNWACQSDCILLGKDVSLGVFSVAYKHRAWAVGDNLWVRATGKKPA